MGMIAGDAFPIDPIHDLGNGLPACVWKRTIPSCKIRYNTPFYLLGVPTDSGIVLVKHLMDKVFPIHVA